MHVVLAVAISKDGFINQVDQKHSYDWTSSEDKAHFAKLLRQHTLYLMGRQTYEHNRGYMRFSPEKLRVVFTRSPNSYTPLPGMLEFTTDSPQDTLARLSKDGFQDALLWGGGKLFTDFLEAGLVDEAYVTIEPQIFGAGTPFNTKGKTLAQYPYLTLESDTALNKAGTRLFHYVRREA